MKNVKYKLIIFTLLCILQSMIISAYAYEDCIISTDGKLTDIKIQHNNIIDVFPIITLMNDKNTLIVHPIKSGTTKFTILKNNKEKFLFNVNVTEESTSIDNVNGFEIFTVDCPPGSFEYYFDLDEPPATERSYTDVENLDEPPLLRG